MYGLTKNINTYNPLRVALHEYASIGRDLRSARGFRQRMLTVLASPGWNAARTSKELSS